MDIKQQIKSFYRENKTVILVGAISVFIGVMILFLNYWNYTNSTDIYSFGPEDLPEERRKVTMFRPFNITFDAEDQAELDSLTIELVFESVQEQTTFSVYMNEEEIEDGIVGLDDGAVQTFNPDPDIFLRQNLILVEGEFGPHTEATIESMEVTGYTNMQRYTFLVLNIIGIIIAIGPLLVIKYRQFQRRAQIEDRFPDFVRDVVEGVRSGMSLPQSIENTSSNDYGALTKYVEQMSAKIEWGIPFDQVLQDFADETDSKIIRRATNTIIQSYESGGNVDEVLGTVGNNIEKVKQLERERKSELYGQMVAGYVVYFIFLGIMVALINYLLPAMTIGGDVPTTNIGVGVMEDMGGISEMLNVYRPIFRNLVVIQSIFSGLVIGKLSEGELKAGGKHVAILLIVGYTVAVMFM